MSSWSRWPGVFVLFFLALHSTSYGLGFIVDPVTGAGEFGRNDPSNEAAENLAALMGVVLVLVAVAACVAATLLVRRHRSGGWLTVGLGAALLAVGGYWVSRGNAWDAGFYGVVGGLLVVTGATSLLPEGATTGPDEPSRSAPR